jgi:hypothetical protein
MARGRGLFFAGRRAIISGVKVNKKGTQAMWIFTNYGFVSAVAHSEKAGVLLVRAREPGVLEKLCERHAIPAKVETTPCADYLYRMEFGRKAFAAVVSDEITRIDYPNFKSSVRAAQPANTSRLHAALMDVWCVMRGLQQETARSLRSRRDANRAAI